MTIALRDALESGRKVIAAHLDLKRAHADEASPRVIAAKEKTLIASLETMTKRFYTFEKTLETSKARVELQSADPGVDWAGFFRSTVAFMDLFRASVKGDPSAVRKARDIIDAEYEYEDVPRRR